METLEILKELCLTPGVTGYEKSLGISRKMAELMEGEIDEIGNAYKIVGDGDFKIIVEAHIDEVGFKTTVIKDNLVKFVPVGGINPEIQLGSVVQINKHTGIIQGGKTFREQYIDLGIEENIEIKPNTPVYFRRMFEVTRDNYIISPALDNRTSCTVLCKLAKAVSPSSSATIYLLGSVQHEQGGFNGLKYFERKILPDMVIGLDSAYAKPYGDEDFWWNIPEPGKGPAIQPSGKGFVVDDEIVAKLQNTAEKEHIPYQWEIPQPDKGGLTISVSMSRKVALNIPVRYQHTAMCMCNLSDIENSYYLIKKFLEEIVGGK